MDLVKNPKSSRFWILFVFFFFKLVSKWLQFVERLANDSTTNTTMLILDGFSAIDMQKLMQSPFICTLSGQIRFWSLSVTSDTLHQVQGTWEWLKFNDTVGMFIIML